MAARQRSGKENADITSGPRVTGKSIWKGRDGEVSVEELALEHFETLNYRGCVACASDQLLGS